MSKLDIGLTAFFIATIIIMAVYIEIAMV